MGNGFSEAALAVFTTLAPMGACAFIVLTIACFKGAFETDASRKLDRVSFVPLAVCVAGFIAAFFHLASPFAAFGVFAGVGRSPLTNEVLAGGVFVVLALVYCILAATGRLSGGARKGLLVVVSASALVFTVFCGLAYMMYTIPTWNTPASVVQMLGYGLLGGSVLGMLTLALGQGEGAEKSALAAFSMGAVGLVAGAVGLIMQIVLAQNTANIWGAAIDLVPMIWLLFVLFAVLGAVGAALVFAARKKASANLLAVAVAAVAVGVFFARIAFYGLFMSVAL